MTEKGECRVMTLRGAGNDRERRMSGNNRRGIKPDNDGLLCCHT